ncbi:MAG TPA: hypothetical protein VF407_09385 [Polyangiaceae bacterium]
MNRSISLVAASLLLGLGASTMACDKTAQQDQDKVNQAQATADQKIQNAQAQAATTITNATVEADKKIADANADFMKMRESYRHDEQSNLIDLDGKIEKLNVKEHTATGTAKTSLDTGLSDIQSKRTAFLATMQNVEASTAATWDDAKAKNDKAWTDLKNAVDKASPTL